MMKNIHSSFLIFAINKMFFIIGEQDKKSEEKAC